MGTRLMVLALQCLSTVCTSDVTSVLGLSRSVHVLIMHTAQQKISKNDNVFFLNDYRRGYA